jgi:hypothetical protein
MANRFWVGGTNTWNATAGTKWATTSGGAGGAAVPTAADDVFFDAGSAAAVVTMAAGDVARSVDCTGFTGTLSLPASTTISIGDATAGAGNNAFKTVSGMTYTIGSTTTSIINFISTSATVQTLTTGGKTWPTYTINGAGSSYQYTDAHTIANASTLTLTAGTLDTNGQTCSWGLFISNGASTRTLTLGASAITISGSTWNTSTTTGMTFNANTSSITQISGNANFQTGGLTFNNVTLGGNSGTLAYSGASTFANLTISGFASGRVAIANDLVITGTFTMASSSSTSMSQLQSSARGTQRTITAAVVSLTNHNLQDINAAGASAPWSATSNIGDMGGNSNITFSTPVTRYWVATAGGSFNATSSWSTSSGGASGASIPLCHDTAVFDSNSITSAARTITINVQCCPPLDFSNLTNTPAISTVITNGNIYVNGSLKYTSAVTASGTTGLIIVPRFNANISSNGLLILSSITMDMPGNTLTLNGDLSTNLVFTLTQGTLDANNFNITMSAFSTNNSNTRTITMGSGTWTLTATNGNVWNSGGTVPTINYGTSTIAITDTGASSKTFNVTATLQSYNNVSITPGGAGAIIFSGILSFNDFTCTGGSKTISFTTASKTIRGNFNVVGTAGNLISLTSQTPGTPVNLNKTSGTVNCNYLSIQDSNANGGALWFAGPNSTNVSGNSGWVFTAANYALTKSLQYAVKTVPAITKSLQYAIRKSPAPTKSLKYTIIKTLSLTKSLKYQTPGFHFVQTKRVFNGATNLNPTLTPDTPFIQGSLVVLTIKISGGGTIVNSVTDDKGNTYAQAGTANTSSSHIAYQYYAVQVTAGATITVHLNSTADIDIIADEFTGNALSNAAVFDIAATNTNASSTSESVTLSPTSPGRLIVGSFAFDGSVSGFTPGTNYVSANVQSVAASMYRLNGTTSETAPASWTTARANIEVAGAYIPRGTSSITKTASLKYTVKASASALTKSLRYAIRATPAAPTKSLRYAIKQAATAATKSLKYTIKATPAAPTKSLKYTVRITRSAITKGLVYDIRKTTAIVKTLVYDIKRPASVTKSLVYDIKKTFSVTKSLRYTIRKTPALTKSLQYKVHATRSALTKSLVYALITRTIKTKSMVYEIGVKTTVTDNRPIVLRAEENQSIALEAENTTIILG